jgi:hypothetical protein
MMKYVLVVGGLFLVAGAAGSQDFYEECRAAADCVAGDPPSFLLTIFQMVVGLVLMVTGVAMTFIEDKSND